ncbi:unnamed protein product [Symbiodinium necroappetens]|uniref:Uncharacterized protein n=1 Tax=Symbiodinium necroappetens TaxID=1628268 RepID=A0A812QP65_9DINO|nr:unnamed protein product [Symbiodinium necroappetens]
MPDFSSLEINLQWCNPLAVLDLAHRGGALRCGRMLVEIVKDECSVEAFDINGATWLY